MRCLPLGRALSGSHPPKSRAACHAANGCGPALPTISDPKQRRDKALVKAPTQRESYVVKARQTRARCLPSCLPRFLAVANNLWMRKLSSDNGLILSTWGVCQSAARCQGPRRRQAGWVQLSSPPSPIDTIQLVSCWSPAFRRLGGSPPPEGGLQPCAANPPSLPGRHGALPAASPFQCTAAKSE
jgi:hypothetical protein